MARRGRKPKAKPVSLPGKEGLSEIVMAGVDDPFERGKTLEVRRNIRASSLLALFYRGRLGSSRDAIPRLVAGARFQRAYELAEIGGARAIDYSAVKVDTSMTSGSPSDAVHAAMRELAAIRAELGPAYAVLEAIAGRGVGVVAYASAIDGGQFPSRSTRLDAVELLLATLDALIEFYGVAVGAARPRTHDA